VYFPGPCPAPAGPHCQRDVGRCLSVLLADEVHARGDAEDRLPATGVGGQERAPARPRHPGQQPPVVLHHFFGPLPVPRKVIFLAKSEYFAGHGLKGLISKAFFTGVGQIPVDRAGGAAGDQAIRTGLQVLAAGHVLGIYPEGTRSPDGRLYRGKTGVARLAIESGAPVVPCAGPRPRWPPGAQPAAEAARAPPRTVPRTRTMPTTETVTARPDRSRDRVLTNLIRIHPRGPSRPLRLLPCESESSLAAATAPALMQ
jgi:Acyltransferase